MLTVSQCLSGCVCRLSVDCQCQLSLVVTAAAMDVLYRDLRTVRVRMLSTSRPSTPRHNHLRHESSCCARCTTSHTHSSSLTNRLGEVLTLSACLLSLLPWPSAMAAPSGRRRGIPADHTPLWVNPCGYYPLGDEPPVHEMTLTDKDMLNNIYIQDINALASVEEFKKDYVQETFDVSFDDHHKSWEQKGYDWLFPREEVPKSLGKHTEKKHLENIELDSFLKDAYRRLQIMAVALEQVAWDQKYFRGDSKYVKSFNDIEYKLRSVLCEIQLAMIERNVTPYPDVTRDVMTDEFRDIDNESFRNLRDWFIFRDYMIVLEYIKDVVQYFLDHPNKIPSS